MSSSPQEYCPLCRTTTTNKPRSKRRLDWWSNTVQVFAVKLVLEVFGGAGAIWGFSEAIGLRTVETLWFWRPAALTMGAIFGVRWMMQVLDHGCDTEDNLGNNIGDSSAFGTCSSSMDSTVHSRQEKPRDESLTLVATDSPTSSQYCGIPLTTPMHDAVEVIEENSSNDNNSQYHTKHPNGDSPSGDASQKSR